MGKISDLWVRLGLKKQGFDKGMDDAVKKTKKAGGQMKGMLDAAKAGWAAVGAAVIAFGQQMITATNKVGDAWNNTFEGIKAGWHQLLANLSNTDIKSLLRMFNPSALGLLDFGKFKLWKDAFGGTKEAAEAGKDMAAAFDAEFELVNSVKLQKALLGNELNSLYAMMRDTTLSPTDRKAAADRYKALLQPLAEAEIAVYSVMMEEASRAWQAGVEGLSRQYSAQELTDFFSTYGTDAAGAAAKYPELQRVYESQKGDTQNQVIFDTATKLATAQAEMSRIDKEIARTYVSIKKSIEGMYDIGADTTDIYLTKTLKEVKDEIAEDVREIKNEIIEIEDIDIDLSDIDNDMNAFLESWKQDVEFVASLNQMLSDSIVQSMSNGLQAITDMIVGLEGADMKNALAAFIAPFGDTMKQMGAMIMSEGVAMVAFKESFKTPAAAIAAGAALMAIGSMVSSGLQAMTQNPVGGGSSASYGSSAGASPALNYESTLTVEVVGKISGSDILLSGQKTQNNWNR